ncbi:divergent polysaccharide deacetylase family protein [Thalassotalea sp. PLHSN55]|uniref:divergent polysaccharide deacetylase family protein n=1 Tax=Thalassotalea sp. PLHSN55 TaxID=3435888 RepID=UPI003F85D507
MRNFPSLFFVFSVLFLSEAQAAKVAIVIDDIGYRYTDHRVLELPNQVTFSVLPHTPYGKKIALQGYEKSRDIFLHIPMEAENGKKLGPGGLTTSMNEQDIHQSLNKAFTEIPFALGINNHMGSKLTKLYQPMAWTMSYLKQNQLLFLDSKTISGSQAEQAALDVGVPVRNRHVFLDNQLDEGYIRQQFSEMVAKASKNDIAIAIAHPHPETVDALKKLIPLLAEHNIELVPLSQLYQQQSHQSSIASTAE